MIPPDDEGLFSLENLEILLEKHKDCTLKIASVIGGSNVTGIETPYHDIAEVMHNHG